MAPRRVGPAEAAAVGLALMEGAGVAVGLEVGVAEGVDPQPMRKSPKVRPKATRNGLVGDCTTLTPGWGGNGDSMAAEDEPGKSKDTLGRIDEKIRKKPGPENAPVRPGFLGCRLLDDAPGFNCTATVIYGGQVAER